MQTSPNTDHSKKIPRIAFFLSLAAVMIPICYTLYMIATLPYYRGPIYSEIRLTILIFGLAGALLGFLVMVRRTRYKGLAIFAIIMGLIAPIQHVLFCGTNVLQQKYIILCPMLWGIRIP